MTTYRTGSMVGTRRVGSTEASPGVGVAGQPVGSASSRSFRSSVPASRPVLLGRVRVIVLVELESGARAPDSATTDASPRPGLALLVSSSLPFGKLLPELAALAALHEQQVNDTPALVREKEEARPLLLRRALKLRQQGLDRRDVVEADAQVEVTVRSGLSAQQGIDAPTTVDPVVDTTRVKSAQDIEYIRKRHLSHDTWNPLGPARGLTAGRAQPHRPRLHALDRQHAVCPRVVRKAGSDRGLAPHVHDKQDVFAISFPDGAAENDDAVIGELVHERRVLIPPVLLSPTSRVIPRGPLRELDQVVIGHRRTD
jgi:hypothetical protein